MKYNIKINKYIDEQELKLNNLFYISIIKNSHHCNYIFTNDDIDILLQLKTKDENITYEEICKKYIKDKQNEIWFKNYKDAEKTKIILNQILNY